MRTANRSPLTLWSARACWAGRRCDRSPPPFAIPLPGSRFQPSNLWGLEPVGVRCSTKTSGALDSDASTSTSSSSTQGTIPVTPVGVFKSCFACRNGTPRQGALVPTSVGLVRLEDKIGGPGSNSGTHKHFDGPAGQALKGLDGFSHVWIIWAFDQYFSKNRSPVVKPPRLGGDSIGVFACRSPKRPNPIGMTAAKIERVDPSAATILVSGIDLLDGTPILDIKPYIPTYDSFPGAVEPAWLRATAAPTTVAFDARAAEAVGKLASGSELFPSPESIEETIRSVLASDPRSRISRKHKKQTYAFTLDGLRVRCSFEERGNSLDVRVTDVFLSEGTDD